MIYNKYIVVLTLILLILSYNLPKIASSNNVPVYRTAFNLLAVDEQGNGRVVNVVFEVYEPGSGSVIVEPRDKVMDDVLVSIKYAIVLSSLLTGFNYTRFNYRYVFNVELKVEGLSATLGFLLSFLGFVRNVTAIGFSATGLVSPYGTVGLVSGIGAKYVAAREKGLSFVIGPIYNVDWVAYIGVPDIYTAFRVTYGKSIFPFVGDESILYSEPGGLYNNVFKESAVELYGWINETIDNLRELGVDYSRNIGVKLLNYSQEHYGKGRFYTASSYAFRAFYTLHSLYLKELLMHSSETYINVINEEINWILREISNITSLIKQYSSLNEIDLWDLDALINSYERLSIASRYLSIFMDSGYIDNLALSKARIITARQWLKLIKTHDNGSQTVINLSIIEKTKVSLKTFCSVIHEYFTYLVQSPGFNILNCSSLNADGLMGLIEFSLQLSNLYFIFEGSVSKPIYETYYRLSDLNKLLESIREITWHIYEGVHQQIPSLLSAIELANSYIEDGENISTVAYMLADALPNTPIYITIVNTISNETIVTNPPEFIETNAQKIGLNRWRVSYETPITTVLLVSAITLSMGLGLVVYVVLRSNRGEF